MNKDVFKGGGVQSPPPQFSEFLSKVKGEEVERKRKRNKMGGGGLIINIFFGVEIFSSGVVIFSGGLRNFRGVGEKIYFMGGRGFEKFSGGGVKKFSWEGLRKFLGGVVKNVCGVEKIQGG